MTDAVDPFRIRAIVPSFDVYMAGYAAASAATRARLRHQSDIAYGPAPRQRIDLFFPDASSAGMPVHMFVHGGYWRANVKEDYAFVADTVTSAGAIAAIVEYDLLPGIRMAEQVGQIRAAAAWLAAHAAGFGGDGRKLSASGHSAGGHLVSYLASQAPHEAAMPAVPVKSLLLVSGIYDLRPITRSFLQPELHLTPEEVARWSPNEAQQSGRVHFEVAVGHNETEPFHTQAHDYAYAAEQRGADVERMTLPAHDHMTIVRDMGVPGTPMADLVVGAIERSRR